MLQILFSQIFKSFSKWYHVRSQRIHLDGFLKSDLRGMGCMGGWENSISFIRQPSVSLSLSLFLCFFGMSVSYLIHVASLIHFTSPMWLHGSLRNYLSPSISLQMDTVFSYISLVLGGFSVACGIGSLRNYPLPFIPLQRDVVFAYISLLLSGSAETCGIIRSPPFRCREVSFSHTFHLS